MTIAGSDSIAGAGIQADLKTFAAFGIYGTSTITAVTAQNTRGVRDVYNLPPAHVRMQIDTIAADIEIAAIKTGMLADLGIVAAVAQSLRDLRVRHLVVDPVMASGDSGRRTLLSSEGVKVLRSELLPLADVVTPNVAEAGVLAGMTVDSVETAREAARKILDLGPSAVIVKGGHLVGNQAIDVFVSRNGHAEFTAVRSNYTDVHGTGCTFASAIAAGLALGETTQSAIARAKTYVTGAIEHSIQLSDGARLLDHFWNYTGRPTT